MESNPIYQPSSAKKNEMLLFGLRSTSDDQLGLSMDLNPIHHLSPAKKWNAHILIMFTSDDWPGWSMDLNPIHHPSPAKKMKSSFLYYVQLLMLARLVNGLEKKWNACFWIMFTSDDLPGWLMNSNPICHPSPTKKMKCSIFDYIQLLMISQAGKWTWTPSTTPLQPKTWNAHFWILFNFWWSARLVNGLEPHLPPLSSQKSEMLIFVLQSTSDLGQTGQWTQTPSTTRLQPIKWNVWFWITLNFWWLTRLVDGLKPHPPPLFSQKMKSSFLDYVQLLMINQAGQWTRTPSASPLQPIKWNAHIFIMFNFWWSARLVNGLKTHLPPLSSQ